MCYTEAFWYYLLSGIGEMKCRKLIFLARIRVYEELHCTKYEMKDTATRWDKRKYCLKYSKVLWVLILQEFESENKVMRNFCYCHWLEWSYWESIKQLKNPELGKHLCWKISSE